MAENILQCRRYCSDPEAANLLRPSTFTGGSRFTKCVFIDESSASAAQLSLLYLIICEPIFYLEEGLNVNPFYGTNTLFLLKADRLHPRDYPHKPYDHRYTDKYVLRVVEIHEGPCEPRQS